MFSLSLPHFLPILTSRYKGVRVSDELCSLIFDTIFHRCSIFRTGSLPWHLPECGLNCRLDKWTNYHFCNPFLTRACHPRLTRDPGVAAAALFSAEMKTLARIFQELRASVELCAAVPGRAAAVRGRTQGSLINDVRFFRPCQSFLVIEYWSFKYLALLSLPKTCWNIFYKRVWPHDWFFVCNCKRYVKH